MSLDSQVVETVRTVLADPRVDDVRATLLDLGFLDLLALEPHDTIRDYFEEQGRSPRLTGALDLILAGAGRPPAPLLYELAYDSFTAYAAAGSGTALRVDGLVLEPPAGLATVRLPMRDVGRLVFTPLRIAAGAVASSNGFSHGLPVARVSSEAHVVEAGVPGDLDADSATARVRFALASELLGIACAVRDLTIDHVAHRRQFGAPIGTRQVVRHRLADVEVAAGAARAVLDSVVLDDPVAAAAAKALASRAAQLACSWALQFGGAMGFTVEHTLPRYVRKAQLLDGLFGSTDSLTRGLGRAVLDHGVPELIGLDMSPTQPGTADGR